MSEKTILLMRDEADQTPILDLARRAPAAAALLDERERTRTITAFSVLLVIGLLLVEAVGLSILAFYQ